MISSLLYVLIVTPVLFSWIHERRLGVVREQTRPAPFPRTAVAVIAVIVAVAATGWWVRSRPQTTDAVGTVLETVRTGDLVITLSNADGALRQGANNFRIEFRSARTNERVDVGMVTLGAAMTMPGMVMTSPITIAPAGLPGVYNATGEYSMAGSWQMTLEWNGPAGRGSAAFDGEVQ
jgi:hypothetical protein